MVENASVTVFTVSELLRENQEEGIKFPPPRSGLKSLQEGLCNTFLRHYEIQFFLIQKFFPSLRTNWLKLITKTIILGKRQIAI